MGLAIIGELLANLKKKINIKMMMKLYSDYLYLKKEITYPFLVVSPVVPLKHKVYGCIQKNDAKEVAGQLGCAEWSNTIICTQPLFQIVIVAGIHLDVERQLIRYLHLYKQHLIK